MRALLSLLVIISTVHSTCPPAYNLTFDKCVRPLFLEQKMVFNDQIPRSRIDCAKDDATLPIVHSPEDNTRINNIAESYPSINGKKIYVILDLVCDQVTHRLIYNDGTAVDYIPEPQVDTNFDCMKEDRTFFSRPKTKDWDWMYAYKEHTVTVLCIRDPIVPTTPPPTTTTTKLTTTPKPTCPPCPTTVTSTTARLTSPATSPAAPLSEQCGDYEPMDGPSNSKEPCLKLYTDPLSWDVAQKTCAAEFGSLVTINSAEENKFFWRTAVSSNILAGIHIGAHQSAADPTVWTWVDGEVPFNGKTYDNFIGSFPIPGGGECGSMLTESPSALWINEDCSTNKQAFFCRRGDFSKLPKTCPKASPAAGEDIIPPGFPISNIPCEYVLFVGASKLVEIEILSLVTDGNRDVFEILEGPSGNNLIASLTGIILAPTKIRTAKSNVARVNWLPNGTGNSRGFKIRYYEFDP